MPKFSSRSVQAVVRVSETVQLFLASGTPFKQHINSGFIVWEVTCLAGYHTLVFQAILCFPHLGARRFVTLDFGRPILLTDVLIPTCGDLASLSIDIWTLGEEVDGRRLVVATDISTHSLILHDLLPPPVCRFMKVKRSFRFLMFISTWTFT